MLYRCYDEIVRGESMEDTFETIKERYREIIEGLGLTLSLEDEFARIKNAFLAKAGKDYAASRGEYLNGIILAEYLGFDFIDAAEVIFFHDDGTYDAERTNTVLKGVLSRHTHAVIPGFYGSMPNDTIKTFSRGGSDITGSIIARAADATLYENWTDVSGFLMADPRVVPSPRVIETITYRELRELSYMGATVLHEDAIFPVQFAGIPINIRNTNRPEDPGTMIVSATDRYDTKNIITGIAGKKGFTVIGIEKDMMNAEIGFARRVLSVFEEQKLSFEHLPSGIDTMSVVVKKAEIADKREQLLNGICKAVTPDSVSIEEDMALIAVVGRAMVKAKGVAARVFSAIAKAEVNIRMIDQGSSELNIIIGVNEDDFERAMNAIYSEFIH